MQSNIIDNRELRNITRVFADRIDAGHQLADLLRPYIHKNTQVLAIPAGGFPVARTVCDDLDLPLDFLVASKMLLPGHTEVGFGGIAFDGSEWLNMPLIDRFNLSKEEIEHSRQQAKARVERRFQLFCNNQRPPIKGRQVIVVDDGLASGATLYAAIEAVKKLSPAQLIVALPTGSDNSVKQVAPLCDLLVCTNIRAGYPYAVASAYRYWDDVNDQPIVDYLRLADRVPDDGDPG